MGLNSHGAQGQRGFHQRRALRGQLPQGRVPVFLRVEGFKGLAVVHLAIDQPDGVVQVLQSVFGVCVGFHATSQFRG